jgi:hypothetical protein
MRARSGAFVAIIWLGGSLSLYGLNAEKSPSLKFKQQKIHMKASNDLIFREADN